MTILLQPTYKYIIVYASSKIMIKGEGNPQIFFFYMKTLKI